MEATASIHTTRKESFASFITRIHHTIRTTCQDGLGHGLAAVLHCVFRLANKRASTVKSMDLFGGPAGRGWCSQCESKLSSLDQDPPEFLPNTLKHAYLLRSLTRPLEPPWARGLKRGNCRQRWTATWQRLRTFLSHLVWTSCVLATKKETFPWRHSRRSARAQSCDRLVPRTIRVVTRRMQCQRISVGE